MIFTFLYTLVALAGSYCGEDKPFITDIKLNIVNETCLDLTVKMPLVTPLVCDNQIYTLKENNDQEELLLEGDCISDQLTKYDVSLEHIYYSYHEDTINIETNDACLILEAC